ncbi:MAG TPA: signal peptidase I [Gemmatimonadales bacterium]|nr:signal peptidase I [Gemmatimonadales bacterium]
MKQRLIEGLKTLAVAFGAWLVISTFLVQGYRIPSESMEGTLLPGDWLFVTKALYGAEVPVIDRHMPAIREPRRGDIVVFHSVEEDLTVVKRVMGLPGDTLSMRDGVVTRNGEGISEPYVTPPPALRSESPEVRERMRRWQAAHFAGPVPSDYHPDLYQWGPVVVPAESLFVMGDNRDESYDGRYWGFLPRRNVRGAPLIIYYSYDPASWRPLPFLSAIRWGRLGKRPR